MAKRPVKRISAAEQAIREDLFFAGAAAKPQQPKTQPKPQTQEAEMPNNQAGNSLPNSIPVPQSKVEQTQPDQTTDVIDIVMEATETKVNEIRITEIQGEGMEGLANTVATAVTNAAVTAKMMNRPTAEELAKVDTSGLESMGVIEPTPPRGANAALNVSDDAAYQNVEEAAPAAPEATNYPVAVIKSVVNAIPRDVVFGDTTMAIRCVPALKADETIHVERVEAFVRNEVHRINQRMEQPRDVLILPSDMQFNETFLAAQHAVYVPSKDGCPAHLKFDLSFYAEEEVC